MSFQRFLSFGGFFFLCVLIFKMSIIDDAKTYMWYRHITSSDYEFFTQFLTANFVHYSFMHMLLNIAGFFIIWHCFFGITWLCLLFGSNLSWAPTSAQAKDVPTKNTDDKTKVNNFEAFILITFFHVVLLLS